MDDFNRDAHQPKRSEPLPMARFGARLIDFGLTSVGIALVSPHWTPFQQSTPWLVDIMLACLVLMPFEAFLLATWGTTPGKWLYGIRVENASGTKPTFRQGATRAFHVWLRGLAAALPFFSIYALFAGYYLLRRERTTSWDIAADTQVRHLPVTWKRLPAVILVCWGLVWSYDWAMSRVPPISWRLLSHEAFAVELPYFDHAPGKTTRVKPWASEDSLYVFHYLTSPGFSDEMYWIFRLEMDSERASKDPHEVLKQFQERWTERYGFTDESFWNHGEYYVLEFTDSLDQTHRFIRSPQYIYHLIGSGESSRVG